MPTGPFSYVKLIYCFQVLFRMAEQAVLDIWKVPPLLVRSALSFFLRALS